MLRRIALSVLIAGSCLAQDFARMDQVVQAYVARRQFMGSVLVARGGDILFSRGYGSANLEWDVANSPTTKFRLGSVTKQFTAASFLVLEERGKLSVADPVKKYMPDAPAAWDKVTLMHLLTHTSGIPSFTDFPDYRSLEPFPTTAEKLVARFRDKPLEFQPGEKWKYSNSGYVLLGYLLEKITGGSYEKFVRENILTPLRMTASGYDSNSAVIPRRASGYTPGPNGIVNAGYIDMSVPHAAGALYSTTGDLLLWQEGLYGGKLLSPASLAKMTAPFKSNYGFGLMIETVDGRKVIQHGGGIEGFNTMLAWYPETKVTVAVLANLNGTAAGDIARKLGTLAHGGSVQLPAEHKEITLAPQVLARYVGTYEFMPGMNMLVYLEGTQLMTKLGGQPAVPIYPESETQFFVKVVDAQIEFGKDAGGAVTHLVLHQGGRDQKAPRKSDKVELPPARKEITVSPAILKQYPGTYALQPGFEITVTLEGDQLMAQATGQQKFPLFAESETRFFYKVVDAQIDFIKDDRGAVTHLVLHQGGRDMKAARK